MNKKTLELGKNLSLRNSNGILWGKTHDTYFSTHLSGENNTTGYVLEFAFNKPQPQLIERIISHPKLADLKLKPKFFSQTPITGKKEIHRLIYNKLIYSFKNRSTEEIPKILEVVQELVASPDREALNVCEGSEGTCNNKSDRPRLLNGVMVFLCSSCLERLRHDSVMAQKNLETLAPNYALGSILGLLAALAGAAVWLIAALTLQKDLLILSILSGFACGYAYRFGAKKVDMIGKVVIPISTIIAFFLINVIYTDYLIKQETGVFQFQETMGLYLSHLAEDPSAAFFDYLFPLIGAGYTLYVFQKDKIDFQVEE